jgi:hypothetical protein
MTALSVMLGENLECVSLAISEGRRIVSREPGLFCRPECKTLLAAEASRSEGGNGALPE